MSTSKFIAFLLCSLLLHSITCKAQTDTLHLYYRGLETRILDSNETKIANWAKSLNGKKVDVEVLAYYNDGALKKYSQQRCDELFLVLNRKARNLINIKSNGPKKGAKSQRSVTDIVYTFQGAPAVDTKSKKNAGATVTKKEENVTEQPVAEEKAAKKKNKVKEATTQPGADKKEENKTEQAVTEEKPSKEEKTNKKKSKVKEKNTEASSDKKEENKTEPAVTEEKTVKEEKTNKKKSKAKEKNTEASPDKKEETKTADETKANEEASKTNSTVKEKKKKEEKPKKEKKEKKSKETEDKEKEEKSEGKE